MNILNHYNIPYKGLKNGKHHFDFKIDDRFFNAFGDSEIKGGDADVEVELDRAASMLQLRVTINGNITTECDRCLGELTLPVDYSGELTVKFSDEIDEYDGEVMWLNPAEAEVPLAQYIYESIVLSLPYRKVHEQEGCDPEMLSRFRIVSQEEFDRLTADVEVLEENPETEKLRALRDKMEEETK